MAIYSISDLSRKSGDIIADALRQPVTITQRNKPRLVLLSFEEFLRLIQNSDPRTAGMTANMPADLFEQEKNLWLNTSKLIRNEVLRRPLNGRRHI